MIYIRVNRDPSNRFIDLHIKGETSASFPGCHCTRVNNLDNLIITLLEVQRFMDEEPKPTYQKWEVA